MRVRLLALLSAVALFLLAAAPAHAESDGTLRQGFSYLALGDSVPFGYSPLVNPADPDNFIGYPELVAKSLHLQGANAACPGEATGGFLSLSGADNGCRGFRFHFNLPLHVSYAGTQMAFALAYLHMHPKTRLVTLMLGANDAFVFLRAHPECAPTPPPTSCLPLLGALFTTIGANLNTILSNLRSAGYAGLIVAVTYYALNYAAPSVAGTVALNGTMIGAAQASGALVASGFNAWQAKSLAPPANGDSCLAGLRIVTPTGCDVHPTLLGHQLLADAVIQTIAGSCSADEAAVCLDKNND